MCSKASAEGCKTCVAPAWRCAQEPILYARAEGEGGRAAGSEVRAEPGELGGGACAAAATAAAASACRAPSSTRQG